MTDHALIAVAFEADAIRIVERDNDPWFVASDVAVVLGYRDAFNLTRGLDHDEKGTHIVSTLGGTQEMTIISESGLYNAAFRSRRPEAVRLRRWVTSDVLPTIRRTGGYGMNLRSKPAIDVRGTLKLLSAIREERNAEARTMLHQMLSRVGEAGGFNVPGLEALTANEALAPHVAEALAIFWERYDWLVDRHGEEAINLHRNPALIAISLPDFERRCAAARLALPAIGNLRAALKADPRFVANTTVNTPADRTVNCWIFRRDDTVTEP